MADIVLDRLIAALDKSATRSGSELLPVAVLWPDAQRQWQSAVTVLRNQREILELGEYAPADLKGTAYWIRAVVDGAVPVGSGIGHRPPIIYLPGFGRSDIRGVEDADEALKPLAELQYRGSIFSQSNGRDWTLAAFLQSKVDGLGLDLAEDNATKDALYRARKELLSRTVEELVDRGRLRADYFDSLIAPDLDKDVLLWLQDPEALRSQLQPDGWEAFRQRFSARFGLTLEDGEAAATGQLGRQTGPWVRVWRRYAEAPRSYPRLEQRLRDVAPKRVKDKVGLFDGPLGAWPQDNEEGESRLRKAYGELASLDTAEAAQRLARLEGEHAGRRSWVWASLGQAPLATASGPLAELAIATRKVLPYGSVGEVAAAYAESGWQADDLVMRALAAVTTKVDRDAVVAAVQAVYTPWLDESVRRFQSAVGATAEGYVVESLTEWPESTCVIFVDGLRFDVGKRAEAALLAAGYEATVRPRLTALPTITSTAKPAASPIAGQLVAGSALAPSAKAGGSDLAITGLRSLLGAAGYQVLQDGETGDPAGRAWTEHGDIDELGHKQEVKLPSLIDAEVGLLRDRIATLFGAGWQQIVVVTDHGWLYVPEGLPKVELPQYLTKDDKMRKGRTGRLADGAVAPGGTVPWYWDPSVRMAVAPGISAFLRGQVYEHGGVSPQECVTPVIVARATGRTAGPVVLTIAWRGLRPDVEVANAPDGSAVDIRMKAGDPTTSIVKQAVVVDADGRATLVVVDDDAIDRAAYLVALGPSGSVLAQLTITVGGVD